MSRRTSTQARNILTDATVIATLIDAALTALDIGLQGWPETTPGASPASQGPATQCNHRNFTGDNDCTKNRPCPDHGEADGVHLTTTERFGTTPDQARHDLDALTEHIHQAAHHTAKAARITHRWGLKGVTDTEITIGLTERLEDIWCRNCAKAGISTVHRIGRQECAFCEQFRLAGACGVRNPNNHPAPKPLLDIHFSRRINSGDITRTMTATYGPTWNRKLGKKGHKAA